MSSIIVKTEQLTKYGTDLEDKATEFSALLKSMDGIVTSISGAWSGTDASNFISNASAYINNLKIVESTLLSFGNMVKNHSVQYNNRCADFYSKLG
jgi:uncharacterized protein YukE